MIAISRLIVQFLKELLKEVATRRGHMVLRETPVLMTQ